MAHLSSASRVGAFTPHANQGQARPVQNPHQQEPATKDSSAFSFGRQKRRRGLQSSDRTSTIETGSNTASSFNVPYGQPRLTEISSRMPELNGSTPKTSSNGRQEPESMPPHLAASLDRSQGHRRRPVFGPRSEPGQQLEQTKGSRRSSASDERRASQQGASTSAAEVSDTGDKAEGVLQLGASGARIPLYGRFALFLSFIT